ncbi:MAG: hypothetical protein RL385_495 [Pseudomonadota bacterium]|jgi:hypothetical protein
MVYDSGDALERITAYGRTFAFIGLERHSGIVAYDSSNPQRPAFAGYALNRDCSAEVSSPAAGDLGPEGLHFIAPCDSPSAEPVLVVGNEVSGSTNLYRLVRAAEKGGPLPCASVGNQTRHCSISDSPGKVALRSARRRCSEAAGTTPPRRRHA